MRKLFIALVAAMVLFQSCDDYLDINDNPNKATDVSADLVLPQALVATALVLNAYNSYGMQIGGYAANAGGYGGFNETVSYAYTPNNYSNLWPVSYDNLEDYQYIINQTTDTEDAANFVYYNAVARIMKAFNFQMLVDTYNNVPYTDALQGADMLTPTYEDAATIYAKLAGELDLAIAGINAGLAAAVAPKALASNDVVFGGDVEKWKQFANSVKLRLMVRGRGKVTFANTSFDPVGFLDEDALINPGYTRDNNRQNPMWNTWGFGYSGSAGNKAWIPTTFVMGFYNSIKLDDPGRGSAMYFQFPATGTNQLGYESTGIPKSPDGSFWYPGSNRKGTEAGNATGALKGPNAGFPLMIAAESYFLQAEALVVGLPVPSAGTAKSLFEAGIAASFNYVYQRPDGSVVGDPEGDAADYIADNGTYLAQFDMAATTEQQIEAIITQKYIALNMVNSAEGWNEYRRTGYPKLTGTGPNGTFASTASQSTRPDRLPARILYPTSEIQYNPDNVPQGVSPFTSTIFWAK